MSIKKLQKIADHVIQSGYGYNLSSRFNEKNHKLLEKGETKDEHGVPIKKELNCEGAADFFIYLAKQEDINTLQKVKYASPFFVPTNLHLLGTTRPFISTVISGYEFSNHYRVRDKETGALIDPSFGTINAHNPSGIKMNSVNKDSSVSEYGECLVVTQVTKDSAHLTYETKFLKDMSLIDDKYFISDQEWQ